MTPGAYVGYLVPALLGMMRTYTIAALDGTSLQRLGR